MRTLKFRGICIQTGEFVYGGGVDTQRDTPIIINHGNRHFVIAESVAQFTGFKDVHGVDIYERDIVGWGHIEGFTECRPRQAVVHLEPDLCFKTFNLGEHNHTFHWGSFSYARCLNRAMEVLGSVDLTPELIIEDAPEASDDD